MRNQLALFRNDLLAHPWRELRHAQSAFDRLLSDLTPEVSSAGRALAAFNPSCEVSEDKTQYLMKFDLPGIAREDVKVEVTDNVLTITAERKEETKADEEKRHVSEISYGKYIRSFSLPMPVDENLVKAIFENGVLKVTIPKAEPTKAKRIEVA